MVRGMTYLDYDKISDDLCWLGNSVIVRMNVKLSRKKDNKRYHFHKEFGYSTQLIDYPQLYTIRRSFDYYISLEHLQSKENVMITIRDMFLIRMKVTEVYGWFSDNTFAIKKKKLIILNRKKCIIDSLVCKKTLIFEPIVIENEDGVQQPGIRMTMGSPDVYTEFNSSVLSGFLYIISQIDMYNAAQNLINYIGHPEFGTNLYTFETPEIMPEPKNVIKDRKIPKKKTSFFDKIDDL